MSAKAVRERPGMQIRTDLVDTDIVICSTELLQVRRLCHCAWGQLLHTLRACSCSERILTSEM